MQPPGPQVGAQWAPPGDKPVQNGGGAETSETRGGGGGGSVGEGFWSLREEDKLSTGVQIPREGANRHGRWLASGGQESIQGACDLEADGENPGKGGGGP